MKDRTKLLKQELSDLFKQLDDIKEEILTLVNNIPTDDFIDVFQDEEEYLIRILEEGDSYIIPKDFIETIRPGKKDLN